MFTPEQFASMNYNIHGLEDPFDLPSVAAIPVFRDMKEKERKLIVRYIIYMYDAKTPLRLIRDLNERKNAAGVLAGFKNQTERDRALGPYLDFSKEYAVLIILYFLKIQNNSLWTTIVTTENFFNECVAKVNYKDPSELHKDQLDNLKKKDAVIEIMNRTEASLEALYQKATGGDPVLIEKVQPISAITPEKIASLNLRGMKPKE